MPKSETLLFAHHAPENHPAHVAVQRFVSAVRQRSNGQITIAVVPNSVLGHLPSLFQLVINGQLDMALPPFDRISAHISKFGCIGLPYVFQDASHVDRLLNQHFMDWVAPDLNHLGLHCLSAWEWGFRQLSNTKRPIHTPDDVKGLRIRIPPTHQYIAALKSLGAQPVVAEFSRLVECMKQGKVDGQENPLAVIYSQHLETTQKYLAIVNYCYGTTAHIINHQRLQKLPAEFQTILQEESFNAGCWMRETCRAAETEQIAALEAAHVEVTYPDLALFKAIMQPVHHQMVKTLGLKTLDQFMEMVATAEQPGNAV